MVKIGQFLVTIAAILCIAGMLQGANTSASINVIHTWTAIQHFATGTDLVSSPADADSSTSIATTAFVVPTVTISTSGPVSDPGGTFAFLYNNAAGALTYNAPVGVKGLERCYRNATGKSGVITVQMAASNTVDMNGSNGSSAGTLVGGGALGDGVCINSDATNHWYGTPTSGTWTNN